jgi:small subunit ribosomal protein S20
MPHSRSSKKRVRQTRRRTAANKDVRSAMRTTERRVLELIEEGNRDGAKALLPEVYARLDKAAKRGVIHANTAANHKRKIAKRVGAMK